MYVPSYFLAILCLLSMSCIVFFEVTMRNTWKRSLFGYVERWSLDGRASRSWYILGVRVYTQRWAHSTWLP